jgi:glycosyltransferase involved in cell wall biosynthesis
MADSVGEREQIRISLIVPAFNEAVLLPRLLATVAEAQRKYRYGPEAVEVIVVDNASTDTTPRIAGESGALVVREDRHIIAAVRNTGARAAHGEFLTFIDADSQIHPQTFNVIDTLLSQKNIVGGATGVRLERWSLGIFVTYIIMVLMVWILRMDTGVVFCRRTDFNEMGGYNEDKRVAEDVQFLFDLRRLGRSRGQRLVRAIRVKAIASTRKFDRHGEWYHLGLIWRFIYGALSGRDALNEVADLYWYDR